MVILVVIGYKAKKFRFSQKDIADFNGLVKALLLEPVDGPFYQGLRESTRKLIKQQANDEPNKLLKKSIIEDFNSDRILFNPNFQDNFLDGDALKEEVSFTVVEKDFAPWGLQLIKSLRCFDKFQKYSSPADINKAYDTRFFRQHQILNGLLIIQKFRQYFHSGDKSRFLSGDKAERYLRVKKELGNAGYQLEKDYDLVPYLFILDSTVDKEKQSCLVPIP